MFRFINNTSVWQRIFFLYILSICGIVILADTNRLPVHVLHKIPHYDLYGHFFLYGIMASLFKKSFANHDIFLALWVPAACALLEEISQIFFISRTFSLVDLAFGISGILFFTFNRYAWRQIKAWLPKLRLPVN